MASRRWPLMHRRARYGDAGGAWTGSTSAQNGSRWCSPQTAFSRSRGTSANQPQRGQAIMQLISTELASARIGPQPRMAASNIRCRPRWSAGSPTSWYVTRKQFARVRGRCVASTHCAGGSAVEFPNDVSARSVLVPSRKIVPRRIAEALAAICSAEFVPEILMNSSSAPLPTLKSRDGAPNRVRANHRCAR